MKYLLIAVMLFTAQTTKAQSIDSAIIKMIDSRIAKLPLMDNQAVSKLIDGKIALIPTNKFDPDEILVNKVNDTLNEVRIVNHAEMVKAPVVAAKASSDVVALTNLLNLALVRITTLEEQIKSTAQKIAGLKAITTSTTIIQ